MKLPRLLISAAHKSSGKTTVSVGLCAALSARGVAVQAFKKGPDYIDPMWLAQASGHDCFNLDPFLMTRDEIVGTFARHAARADIGIVEANKGLYDGLALDGSNSNAALAQMLGLPVVLVIDARGMTRGIAPLILGYQAFDRHIRIAGVILNNLGGTRHEAKLRAVIEHYTDVAVLGAIQQDARLAVVERHLGLVPQHELDDAHSLVQTIAAAVADQVDLQRVVDIAASAPMLDVAQPRAVAFAAGDPAARRLRIGVARDKAFGFYYADDLTALEAAGCEIVNIDTLHDVRLPDVDGLFIGGGFPEMFMAELEANAALRGEIRTAIEAGLPVYAECGGLMYLARTLRWQGRCCQMVGAIPGDALMHERPMGRGYVTLEVTGDGLWPAAAEGVPPGLRAHEFHHSSLENLDPNVRFAYRVTRGHGIDGTRDGLVHRNVLASYAHLRNVNGNGWVGRFVAFVRSVRFARDRAARRADRVDDQHDSVLAA